MKMVRRQVLIFIYFASLFSLFFYFWNSRVCYDFSDPDNWSLYRDSFYRSGLFRPFDFRLLTADLKMDTYFMPLQTLMINSLLKILVSSPTLFAFSASFCTVRMPCCFIFLRSV